MGKKPKGGKRKAHKADRRRAAAAMARATAIDSSDREDALHGTAKFQQELETQFRETFPHCDV